MYDTPAICLFVPLFKYTLQVETDRNWFL